ncbi:hypothetical protein [Variovorax boronicumulans]|uniref:hypothetical protein n=1 Tax=Variovorax boronicumulans TaxID=436515 RepID=UPI00278676DB|nr:hypothetical protein [Variovorax boronicumulans]MDQ0040856.1 hypothetical protein [Variovorax boronicumulans]
MSAGGYFFAWVAQAIVVVIGWIVVHNQAAARDRDKARREMISKSADSLADELDELLSQAREYHLKERDRALEVRIKMSLQDAAMRSAGLTIICGDDAALARCRSEIAALRRAVTGNHFEDEHAGALDETDIQFQTIADTLLRAKWGLLQLKHLQYPVKQSDTRLST